MTTKQKTTNGSPELQLQEKFSVEAYADNLIDDLFQDVEKVLEGGSRLPKESVKPEFLSLKPIKVPQIVLPRKMPSPEDLAKQREEEAKAAALAEAKSKEESQSLDKILLGAAFASLVISLSLLLATKGGIEGVVKYFTTTTPEVEAPDPKAEADAKFADYIERSLDSLDKNPNTTGNNSPAPAPAMPVPPPPSELPTVPVEGSPAQNMSNLLLPLNRIADLIEAQAARPPATIPPAQVVIIPPSPQPVPVVVTYNPPPAPAPVAKAEPEAKPAPAPVAKAEPEAKPAPAPVAKAEPAPAPAPTPVAKAEPEVKPAPAPIAKAEPAPAPAPAPAAQAEPEAEVEQKVEQVAAQPQLDPLPPPPAVMASESVALRTIPNYTHTLVGVLELGDRSAALFEINGVARRIYVGESIGASGWMLVKVVEGEATMRRNGEIRSVFVGEQF
ncbi:MAG: hypothetical protein SXA11_18235 [Cyanobacteriota bacterium]|nr:hypothetical protein [Cyanobacteriota bacterium]